MKKRIFLFLITGMILANQVFAQSTSNDVAILYNGNSSVNRETLHFMSREFSSQGSRYSFTTVRDSSRIQPNVYKAIIVLNTGVRSGIDPVLEEFINSWENKSEIILLSLYKGRNEISVTTLEPNENDLGVDAITAASRWEERGIFGGSSEILQMHLDWAAKVIELID